MPLSFFSSLNQATYHGHRAPHKPLLILLSLANLQTGKPRLIPYTEIEEKLKKLLIEFGPHRQTYHPELPFYHLQNDKVWELDATNEKARKMLKSLDKAKSGFFRNEKILGGFPKPIYQELRKNPSELQRLANYLLNAHFPDSIHQDILDAIGLEPDNPNNKAISANIRRSRSPKFRIETLRAYGHQCAVCGFQALLDGRSIGLEAAHIKWYQAGGPDHVVNGLCLCPLHHKLLDRGAFTLDYNLKIQISESVSSHSKAFKEQVLSFQGKQIYLPRAPKYYPQEKFIAWHVKEVFLGH